MRRRGPSVWGRGRVALLLLVVAESVLCVCSVNLGAPLPHLRMTLRGGKAEGDASSPSAKIDSLPKVHAVKRLFSESQEAGNLFTGSSRARREPAAKRITVRGGKAAAMETEGKGEAIDEALYSRQLYVLGHDAMRRMQQARILLVGMGGLGVEIAKDLVLAGVKGLTIHDESEVTWADLASQFYCSEDDIGKNKAEVSLPRIASLNRNVQIEVLEGPVTAESLDGFSLVICSDKLFGECVRVNDACRERGIAFIMTQARGVFSNTFVDFGLEFEVVDTDGENPLQAMVSSISQEHPATVTTLDEARHGFSDGDEVELSEVQGMAELNDLGPLKVKVTGPYTFQLDIDATKFGAYTSGGYAKQVKRPAKMAFKSLREALLDPPFTTSDFAKMDRERQALLGFQAIDSFHVQTGGFPRPGVRVDADTVADLAKQFNSEVVTEDGVVLNTPLVDEVDVKLMRTMAYGAQGQLAPMASVVGSVVAQEALKGISGKFTPVNQFLVFDAEEVLPKIENEAGEVDEEEFAMQSTRYDGQVACLGKTMQEQLGKLSYFLVGAGAIGCEMLKNWAMMGVACGESGAVHCTDMDVIEKSNLNRQFLFRPADIQQLKATVACERAKEMNPALKINTYSTKVGPDTEDTFGDEFFESLDGVCNALDNVQARMYMDQRCVYFRKPLLESGTLGTKGNVQVVIPDVTESYGSSRDPPEKAIPICTLKNFPNAIEHTIQWARDDFEGTFKQSVEDAATYKDNAQKFLEGLRQQPTTAMATVESVKQLLGNDRPQTFQDCVKWARLRFQELFYNQIRQLLFNFPLDMTTSQGQPFWSGAKRPPTALEFDRNDQSHVDFVVAAARLRAINFEIAVPRKIEESAVLDVVSKMKIPEFAPKQGVKIATTEAEETGGGGRGGGGGEEDDDEADDNRQMSGFAKMLPPAASVSGVSVVPIEFDKDADAHIDYVTACSNLRASNYNIAHADKHNTKLIAGKIIPAIATSTSLVTGLVCLELYKLVQKKPLESFKNGFVNLALPFFGFSEPLKAPERTYKDQVWNLWSRFDIDGKTMTLAQFLEHFKSEYKLEVSMVSCGVAMIYSMFSPKSKAADRLAMTMADIVTKVAKVPVGEKQKYLMFEICCSDEDGEEVEAPSVRLALK